MANEEDIEETEGLSDNQQQKRKKMLILLLPLLIVIGVSVGIFLTIKRNNDSTLGNYNIVQFNKSSPEEISVFYDLPEISTTVKNKSEQYNLRLKINLELGSVEDLKVIEVLTPKLTDMILSHIIELTISELEGSQGLYWLKEELFYRLNLAANPIKIKNISFSVFELQK